MTYWLWDAREAYPVTAEEAVEFLESGVRGEGSADDLMADPYKVYVDSTQIEGTER